MARTSHNFSLKRTATGLVVRGSVPTTPATSRPVLERIRAKAPNELRFRVIYARLFVDERIKDSEVCEMHLVSGYENCRNICIELPTGEEVVLRVS